MSSMAAVAHMPSRFERPSLLRFFLFLVVAWVVIVSFEGAQISVGALASGLPYMQSILSEMFPPSVSRIGPLFSALLVTMQMAIVGTVLGVFFSVPLSILAAKGHSPHPVVGFLARSLVSLCRTVPDLVWALFFVATVGLGPFAGTLALMMDTMGFCGRFFAEAMEEADQRPIEALRAIGANKFSILACSVFPQSMPSFITASLFSLEKAVRSSVVLGLVGAGGIGIELKVAMDMFRYSEACTVILLIFGLVIVVETASSRLRSRIIE